MKTLNKNLAYTLVITMALFITACNDSPTVDESTGQEIEGALGQNSDNGATLQQFLGNGTLLDAIVSGRTIRSIELPLINNQEFTGRITNLQLTEGPDPGTVLASGRLIGWVNGDRINQTFEDIALNVLDENGDLLDGNGVCQILFLELGPIFLDVLGLVVDVPDPIVVEIRAERGPGNLLGNLLCGLVGILD